MVGQEPEHFGDVLEEQSTDPAGHGRASHAVVEIENEHCETHGSSSERHRQTQIDHCNARYTVLNDDEMRQRISTTVVEHECNEHAKYTIIINEKRNFT